MTTPDQPGPEGQGGEAVIEPAKLLRLATMVRQVLEELRHDGFGDAARKRLDTLYHASMDELGDVLSEDLRAELDRLTQPVGGQPTPSEPELRVAEAQLVGWLEGLFQGMQASALAQQAEQLQALQRQQHDQQQADRRRSSYL